MGRIQSNQAKSIPRVLNERSFPNAFNMEADGGGCYEASSQKTCYNQKYLEKYTHTEINRSRKGDSYAYCGYCRSDFSITRFGRYDIP